MSCQVRDTLETAVEVVEQAVHNSGRIWKWMSWEVVAVISPGQVKVDGATPM